MVVRGKKKSIRSGNPGCYRSGFGPALCVGQSSQRPGRREKICRSIENNSRTNGLLGKEGYRGRVPEALNP